MIIEAIGRARTCLRHRTPAPRFTNSTREADDPEVPDSLFEGAQVDHRLHVLDVPDEVCKARLRARNAAGTHDFAASDTEFDVITRYFVPPSEAEGFRIVRH